MAIDLTGLTSVLYIGDSLTAGMFSTTEATCFRGITDTYLDGIGFGTPGTFIGGSNGTTAGVIPYLSAITATQADLCFIEMGTNDASTGVSLATFEANMRAIAGAVRNGNASSILVFMTTWNMGTTGTAYDAVIADVCTDYSGALLDLSPIWGAMTSYLPAGTASWLEHPDLGYVSDGWHPNDAGHQAIADAIRCLFEDDLILVSLPPTGWSFTTDDYANFVWSASANVTASGGEFGVWMQDTGTFTVYIGAVEAAVPGTIVYGEFAPLATVDAGTTYQGYVAWRATPGSGAFTINSGGSGPDGVIVVIGTVTPMTFTAPAANGSVALAGSVTVSWTTNATVSGGQFAIWAVDGSTGGWYIGDIISANGTDTYTHDLVMGVGQGLTVAHNYYFGIAYRSSVSGTWVGFTTSTYYYTLTGPTPWFSYGGLSLNDGTVYKVLDGFDPGEAVKTFSEYRGYDGSVKQVNVSEAKLVKMHVPLRVSGADLTAIRSAIATLNALVDEGEQEFIFDDGAGAITYRCLHSPRVAYVPAPHVAQSGVAFVDLILYRDPVSTTS